eukprot:scaffold22740_cov31-Attheya_sp.AAC.1
MKSFAKMFVFAITVGIAGAVVASDSPGAGETCSFFNINPACVCEGLGNILSEDEDVCVSHDRTVVDKRFYS